MASTSAVAQPPMPPPNADLATTWAYLEEGVDHIMTKLQTGVSYSKYMSLYTVSYNYCTSSRMHGNQDVGLQGRCMCLLPPLRHLETRLTRLLFNPNAVLMNWTRFAPKQARQDVYQSSPSCLKINVSPCTRLTRRIPRSRD